MADNWRPLLAIADVAGGKWPARARAAAEASSKRDADDSIGVELLTDIKVIFAEKQTDRMASADLAEALAQIEGRPWAEWGRNRDKPITQNALARLLKKFTTANGLAIAPDNIALGDRRPKGYLLDQFTDAFARYLGGTPDSQPLNRYQPTATGTSGTFQTATRDFEVAVGESQKPPWNGPSSGVAVEKGDFQENATRTPNEGNNAADDYPRVCEHCGAPENPDAPINEVAADGRTYWIHAACLDDWLGATDDGGIPPFLRRTH